MKTLVKLLTAVVFSFVALGTEAQQPMTADQYQKLIQLIPVDLSQKDAQYWIDHPGEFSILLHGTNEALSKDSVVKQTELINRKLQELALRKQKEQISKFYQECFGIKVDWSGIKIPTGPTEFKRLELVLQNLTEDQIFDAYAKRFGEDKVWKNFESISKFINREEGGEALRPKGDYAILHFGGDEPDAKHLGKSYNDFSDDGNQYMIVKEGLIAAFRHRLETDKMYDVNGITWFHSLSLDSDGDAMCMYRNDYGRFYIYGHDRDYRGSSRGPRQVVF